MKASIGSIGHLVTLAWTKSINVVCSIVQRRRSKSSALHLWYVFFFCCFYADMHQANGFYGSAGVSKYIPPAYTRAEQRFWTEVERRQLQGKVELREWGRDGWTYHAKGESLPLIYPRLTLVQVSGFQQRKINRLQQSSDHQITVHDQLLEIWKRTYSSLLRMRN